MRPILFSQQYQSGNPPLAGNRYGAGLPMPHARWAAILALLFAFTAWRPPSAGAREPSYAALANRDLVGLVTDSAGGKPIPGADVTVSQSGRTVAKATTDAFGRFTVHNLSVGNYQVGIRYLGFHPLSQTISIDEGQGSLTLRFVLVSAPVELQAIEVRASTPVAVDTRTGDQVYKQDDFHGSPTTTTSQILQMSIAGAVRAPTGEVHIRGQHAEYTYYVDGVPVPSGISGSLNELFDPAVVGRIDFQTGGWDAEYGNKNSAIVNITTRVPTGGFHFGASGYGGSFSANGQSMALSTNAGKFGIYLSGARQSTDMRLEPVFFDTLQQRGVNFHNHGTDLFGFAKIQYNPSDHDVVNLDVNRSRTRFEVPFDSSAGLIDDHQQDLNGFVNLGWRHRFGPVGESGSRSELFVGPYFRDGRLTYTPGVNDQPSFIFFPDTLTPLNLSEDRNFHSLGLKLDYTLRLPHELEFKFGTQTSLTRGHETFLSSDSLGNPGPASDSDLRGSDVGLYAQTSIGLTEQWELRAGARFDNHEAPFAGNQHQLSPRVKLSFFPDPANTLWAYYGRLFIPTNVEDLRAITRVAQGGVAATPTLPERDHFFELGFVHRFPAGVVLKLVGYRKVSTPGIDDNTVPGSAIVTSVNLAKVYIIGIESVIEVHPSGPLSGYLNVALNHGYGRGPITGGFFPVDNPPGYFDEDHDQRLSVVGALTLAPGQFYLSTTGIYGSGLTNGNDPDATFGTGLFDFNRSIKVSPNFILDASAGYTFATGGLVLRPEIFVDNILDKRYLLKGAFFSGPSVGRPRSVQVRLDVGM